MFKLKKLMDKVADQSGLSVNSTAYAELFGFTDYINRKSVLMLNQIYRGLKPVPQDKRVVFASRLGVSTEKLRDILEDEKVVPMPDISVNTEILAVFFKLIKVSGKESVKLSKLINFSS